MKRVITTCAIAAAAAIAYVVPASAHVSAQPGEQPAGGFTVVNFRVPNERPESTNKLEVQFPDGISGARTQPVPGWTATVTMEELDEPIDDGHGGEITEQVASITWEGGEVKDGEFQDFPVSLKMVAEGELGDTVFFPTIQTYDGGEVVEWIEKPASADDDAELERPSPSVTLVEGDDHHGGADDGDEGDEGDEGDDSAADDEGVTAESDGVALGIGILALVVAAFALFRAMRGPRS